MIEELDDPETMTEELDDPESEEMPLYNSKVARSAQDCKRTGDSGKRVKPDSQVNGLQNIHYINILQQCIHRLLYFIFYFF